jgi:NAD(P)-dependent dehydrogenase (short-subunit alcohol dehydrogenase family)
MQSLKNQRVIVTGGSSGLGLGVVEALAGRGAKIMVVARDAQRLAEVESRLGVTGVVGDVTDRALAASLLQEFQPTVLVLNAGAKPAMGPLHEQSWEGFSAPWNSDVKAGFQGCAAGLLHRVDGGECEGALHSRFSVCALRDARGSGGTGLTGREPTSYVTLKRVVPCNVKTSRSPWFQSSDFDNRMPVRPDGDLLERNTSKRRATVSSGRTG